MKPKIIQLKIYSLRKITKESLIELLKESKPGVIYLNPADFHNLDFKYVHYKETPVELRPWSYLEPNRIVIL